MKSITIRTSFLVLISLSAIIALFILGCEQNENTITKPDKLSKNTYPPRPVLAPGESNWKSQVPPELSPTIIADLNTITATNLVEVLIGSGVNAPTITNVTFTGANIAAGTFSGGMDAIGFEDGIILSSGNIASVVGPNTGDATTTNNGLPGDADLDGLIPGFSTNDAAVLEFDFECTEIQVISFQYVFASEEYNEFVNSVFNDVFGFFVNGVNIALIPGTPTPVSINNVNCDNPYNPPSGGSHCELFRNNDLDDGGGSIDTEMDGLTVVFSATASVNPGINHIKLAIADAGDRILDSDVFIKGESFVCAPPFIEVALDIKPQSCPNPVNTKKRGLLPVAILGTADFDVSQVDPSTIQLVGVSSVMDGFEDVATPYGEPLIDCYSCITLGGDGFTDLILKFNSQQFIAALGPINDGDCVTVELIGNLFDGTPIKGNDIIKIIKK